MSQARSFWSKLFGGPGLMRRKRRENRKLGQRRPLSLETLESRQLLTAVNLYCPAPKSLSVN